MPSKWKQNTFWWYLTVILKYFITELKIFSFLQVTLCLTPSSDWILQEEISQTIWWNCSQRGVTTSRPAPKEKSLEIWKRKYVLWHLILNKTYSSHKTPVVSKNHTSSPMDRPSQLEMNDFDAQKQCSSPHS